VQGTTTAKDLSLQDEDGWFHTGDIVSFAPEKGYQIKGRESFFIKIDNEKRAPGELEEAVHLVSPAIKEVIVVPYQAGAMQEKSVALVLTPDRSLTEESIKKSMRQLVQRNLISRWKIPKHLILIYREKLPTQFENEFKREAVYKVVREFILNLLSLKDANNQPVVIFHEKSETRKFEETEILDENRVEALLNQYDGVS
ncbi:MAG: hypothetical protein K2X66_17690, partial [Cyanobacteria bacterium]|nr:hypothetical protein [Cyanobacteriota bacterium]